MHNFEILSMMSFIVHQFIGRMHSVRKIGGKKFTRMTAIYGHTILPG